jgi:hypothetical protein
MDLLPIIDLEYPNSGSFKQFWSQIDSKKQPLGCMLFQIFYVWMMRSLLVYNNSLSPFAYFWEHFP